MKVGIRIKKVREINGLTQFDLAEKVKLLNQSQICKIENGSRSLKVEELINIADALNVSISDLLV